MPSNVYDLLYEQVRLQPDAKAISFAYKKDDAFEYPHYSFQKLDERISQFVSYFLEQGVKPQDKVLFFVKPDLNFAAITFALFKLGAIVVFIDPGMKKKFFFECIKELKPDVVVGVPKAIVLSRIFFRTFSSIRLRVSTQKLTKADNAIEQSSYTPGESELAAILYTSGGTGKPKGVEYTHDIFIQQTQLLQKSFNLTAADIDIPGFPLFSFFTLCMGMNSVIPALDATKPAQCNPKYLYENIQDNQATFIAGSPAIWERLAYYCEENQLTLPSVKYLVMFGAPVEAPIHQIFQKVLTHGDTFTPYGATECLPIANVSGSQLLMGKYIQTAAGCGICVGKPLSGVEIKLDRDDSYPMVTKKSSNWSFAIGEILVHAGHMTQAYHQNSLATNETKIFLDKKLWHRMGDMGYLDEDGNIWFCGRKVHSFVYNERRYYPVMIEQDLNQIQGIKRSALVLGKSLKRPCLIIEGEKDTVQLNEVWEKMDSYGVGIEISEIFFTKKLPVDTRHNIKIDRLLLSNAY